MAVDESTRCDATATVHNTRWPSWCVLSVVSQCCLPACVSRKLRVVVPDHCGWKPGFGCFLRAYEKTTSLISTPALCLVVPRM